MGCCPIAEPVVSVNRSIILKKSDVSLLCILPYFPKDRLRPGGSNVAHVDEPGFERIMGRNGRWLRAACSPIIIGWLPAAGRDGVAAPETGAVRSGCWDVGCCREKPKSAVPSGL